MIHIPIELWQTIMNMSAPKDQVVIKQLCKYLHINILFDNNYLNTVLDKVHYWLSESNITYNVLLRYLIREHSYSKTKLLGLIDIIETKQSKMEKNCSGHILRELESQFGSDSVGCILCNLEYRCGECHCVCASNENIIFIKETDLYYYSNVKCQSCFAGSIKAYVCKECNKVPIKCCCGIDI